MATAAAVQFLPDRVPIRYDTAGEISEWGSRYYTFLFPLEILVFVLFCDIIASVMLKRGEKSSPERAERNVKILRRVIFLVTGMMTVMQLFLLVKMCRDARAGAANLDLDPSKVYVFLMGLIYIPLGNMMPKLRRNGVIGFRVSWTLYNDTTWQKSNRFGGVCLMLVGVFTIISTAFVGGLAATLLMLAYITAALVVMLVYAKRVYDSEREKESTQQNG